MPYIQLADNKSNGAIITFNDITELKKTQLELDKKNESVMRINADLDNFVHTTSHDLLAPLGNIEISISMMNEMGSIDPKLKTMLHVINSSSKKFRSLIQDIATVAKLESGMLEMEMVDLHEIIDNIEWSLESKIKSANATIVRDIGVKHILFAKKNLRSILYNIIANGIKFKSDEPPLINIKISKNADNVIISVQDNGMGIKKDELDKIFHMYGRLHHNIEGHGIGLYLAQKIVHAAGGNIIVESEQGKGSTFSIYLLAHPETLKVTPSLK
jgi:light-regulated signal transduction histidine kinase (bacteriophytochrome)